LTDTGRFRMARGDFRIAKFALGDDEIDYSLYNKNHPSGSAYYGEAIENMPNLEALPNSAYFMRNNLLTLPRDVKAMPYVTLNGFGIGNAASFTWPNGNTATLGVTIKLENVASEEQGWQVVVPDSSLVIVSGAGWSQASISGNVQQYLNDQEIANAVVYEAGPGTTTVDIDRVNTTTTRTLILTFISKSTGAYKHFNLTMPRYPIDQ